MCKEYSVDQFRRHGDESEEAYLWRIGQLIDSGYWTWAGASDMINRELCIDEDKWRDESSFRKRYNAAKKFYNAVFSKIAPADEAKEIMEQRRKLERERIRYRDERNAWQKQNYIDARIEQKLDCLGEQLSSIGKVLFPITGDAPEIADNGKSLLCCLSDLHIGQTFNSMFGQYNTDIARDRLNMYLEEIIRIGKLHGTRYVYVSLLGDNISGNIHISIQVSNRENVIEQIKLSSELISSFLIELSKHFERVFVIGVAGNHSRLVTNKEMAVHDERLDSLITWAVEKITDHVNNIFVLHRNLDSGISDLLIHGKTYISVHGDYDCITQAGISKLVLMLGFSPDVILCGHKHFPMSTEVSGIQVIQSGSLAGSGDSYTIEKRLKGSPNQTVLVCSDKGVDCIYNVKLG